MGKEEKGTVTSVAVATKKSLFGICDCTVHSEVGTGNFSLLQGMETRMCNHTHLRAWTE